MKKIALYISLALALVGGQFISSCSDDKEYPPVIVPEDYGSGKWDNPISVGQVVEGFTGDNVWMTGYIVGWIDTGISNAYTVENVKFETPATVASNMLVAATPDERDITKCVPVQLVSGSDARAALNLVDNPANLGKQVTIKGSAARYFGTAGFKSVSAYNWDKVGIEEETPDTPDVPAGEQVYQADKSSGLDAFTFENVVLPSGSSYVWKVDSKYGLVASSYFGGACHASEAWAISPTIDLTGYKSAVLTFRHAGNKFESPANFAASCTVAVREDGGAWTTVTVPNLCEGTSWTFIDSGNVDLTPFAGKKIQFGFHYVSTDEIAGSWEIDAIKVNAGK